jgi:hypothetical protein
MADMRLCEECGMEFDWQGTTRNGVEYCCEGCATGGDCTCPEHHHKEDNQQLHTAAANQLGTG